MDLEAVGGVALGSEARDLDPRHRGDAREGLPAEAEALYPVQVVLGLDLGRCVGKPAEPEVLFRHAETVVHDADAGDASLLEMDRDFATPRVQAVVQEFPDHRGRAFDHFARGDPPGYRIPEDPYRGPPGA